MTTITPAALTEATRIIRQEAGRLARFARHSDAREEFLAEGHLRALEAWQTYRPERGEWGAHVRMYVRTYLTRLQNRAKSVVTTCTQGRVRHHDASLVAQTDDGESAVDVPCEASGPDAVCEARRLLGAVYARWESVVQTLPEAQANIARALIAGGDRPDVAGIARQHGVTPPTVYRVLYVLRAEAVALAA
jgi:hypothetical protein